MPALDLLSETMACDLLARLFRARGYTIARNIPFREYGVSFHIDGWDAKARVGFEFLTSEDEDHDDLTLDEYKTLMAAQQRGEVALFVIDEVEPLTAADLAEMAEEFLTEAASAVAARKASRGRALKKPVQRAAKNGGRQAARKQPAKKKVANKKAAPKKAANKKTASGATKVKAAKRPAPRKPGKSPAKKQARRRG